MKVQRDHDGSWRAYVLMTYGRHDVLAEGCWSRNSALRGAMETLNSRWNWWAQERYRWGGRRVMLAAWGLDTIWRALFFTSSLVASLLCCFLDGYLWWSYHDSVSMKQFVVWSVIYEVSFTQLCYVLLVKSSLISGYLILWTSHTEQYHSYKSS